MLPSVTTAARPREIRLTLLGVGAMNSPRFAPAGLLLEAGGLRVMFDGGPGAEPAAPLDKWLRQPGLAHGLGVGYDYVHSAVDDHSRLAYSEIHSNERVDTCAAFLVRAHRFYADHGVAVERVMTDNAMAYRLGHAFREAAHLLGVRQVFTRSHRPQTNGKVGRFNRTLLEEWAYVRPYHSNEQRTRLLEGWLHLYNHHRSYTALGGLPPIARVNNLSGNYT
jgi:transposase InsO family protein